MRIGRREPQPVARLVTDPADLAAKDGVLVPEYQELGVFGHLAPGQHGQAAQQTADEQVDDQGIGAKTAAALLNGGLTLDDLPASGRLTGRKGTAITSARQQVLTWRDMIRINDQVPVPAGTITGSATTPLPRPAEAIEKLGLWRRVPSAGHNGVPR
jgi:hypothetical protein